MRHDGCEGGLILADQKSKFEECITANEFVDMNMMNWRRIVDMYCYALFKLHATASIFGDHFSQWALRSASHYTRNGNLGRDSPSDFRATCRPIAHICSYRMHALRCIIRVPDGTIVLKLAQGS